jgi:hypothetical protein
MEIGKIRHGFRNSRAEFTACTLIPQRWHRSNGGHVVTLLRLTRTRISGLDPPCSAADLALARLKPVATFNTLSLLQTITHHSHRATHHWPLFLSSFGSTGRIERSANTKFFQCGEKHERVYWLCRLFWLSSRLSCLTARRR